MTAEPTYLYKILTTDQWESCQKDHKFLGSELDIKDGFIHLSTESQVAPVIEKYFQDIRPLYIAKYFFESLKENIRWEKASNDELYPHLYGVLLSEHMTSFQKID